MDKRRLPVLEWLSAYRLRDLPHDLFAGLMGALSTAPEAMAFAVLAGLPAEMGLYSLLAPLLVYFVLGTSRELSLAPTATLAAVLAMAVAPAAGGDPGRYVTLAVLVAWLVGALLLAASALRLGYLINFVSEPVLRGYLAGAALLIAAAQLGVMFGVEAEGFNIEAIVRAAASSWDEVRLGSAALGLGLLALLYLLHAVGLRALGPAAVVVAGTLLVAWLGIDAKVIGAIPAGLPPLELPPLGRGAVLDVSLGAAALAVLVFLDSTAVARHFANERGYRIDGDGELLALGASNLAAGMTGAVAVSGNMGDSVLVDQAGARTPITSLVTAGLVLLLVLVGGEFANVPLPAFAAIVVYGVLRPRLFTALRKAWQFDRAEFSVAVICLLGVVGIGLIRGLLLAVALTVLVLLARASRPRVQEVGLVEGPRPALVARDRVADARALPGTLVFQPIGGLFFASANPVLDVVRGRLGAAEGVHRVILDLRTVPGIDLTACGLLEQLHRDLASRGIELLLARPNPRVDAALVRYGVPPSSLLRGGSDALIERLGLPPDVHDDT